uniref:Ig-like domain-containing protein n=1 Tax=Podarcis muralis TaxID=64176 RepID=A0A670I3K1_PODMU
EAPFRVSHPPRQLAPFLSLFPPNFLPPPAEHFLFQVRSECHFSNGTQRIRMLERHFFDRQELLYFDSDRGKFVAVAELGEPEVKRANQDKDVLRSEMADVDRFCRVSYEIVDPFFQARRVQPKVKITPTDNIESSPHNTLLICTVGSFFPAGIEIKWFRNGKEEPKVWTTDLIRNGDWTFHIEVMLETKPERGDVYTCQVEHASFEGPVTVKWGRTSFFYFKKALFLLKCYLCYVLNIGLNVIMQRI